MDLVERLRREGGGSGTYVEMARREIMIEAAAEIERLQLICRNIVDCVNYHPNPKAVLREIEALAFQGYPDKWLVREEPI